MWSGGYVGIVGICRAEFPPAAVHPHRSSYLHIASKFRGSHWLCNFFFTSKKYGINVLIGQRIFRHNISLSKLAQQLEFLTFCGLYELLKNFIFHFRSITAESWMGNYNLVDPTGLDITLTRCLEKSCATIPAYEMEAVLEQLSVGRR